MGYVFKNVDFKCQTVILKVKCDFTKYLIMFLKIAFSNRYFKSLILKSQM